MRNGYNCFTHLEKRKRGRRKVKKWPSNQIITNKDGPRYMGERLGVLLTRARKEVMHVSYVFHGVSVSYRFF